MAEYVFKGNAPFEYTGEDGVLLVVHPLDTAEFDEEPGAPWEALEESSNVRDETPPGGSEDSSKSPDVVITPDGPRTPVSEGA